MPYLRPLRGTYVAASDAYVTGAFYVSDGTFVRWESLVRLAGHGQPRNVHGLPLRPMPGGVYNGDTVVDGIYVDWQSDVTRELMFNERRAAVVDQPTHRQLAAVFGPFQHNLHPYRAADCWARRVDRQQARGGQARDPQARDYRRWSSRRWSPAGLAAVAGSPFRCFGIEVEFNTAHQASARTAIARAMVAAGLDTHVDWARWHRAPGVSGWHCTYDSTVSGGEIISDILDGSAASRDEVAAVLRIVRDNGGSAGQSQGMHVHHDVRDFTTADKVRLVDNLESCQDALLAFVGARTGSHWCRPMTAGEFAAIRRTVAAGGAGGNDHGVAWNFGHLNGRGSVEFRALGNTLNGRKVRAWVQAGQAMMTATKAGHVFDPDTTVSEMLTVLRTHGMSTWASDVFAARCGLVTV